MPRFNPKVYIPHAAIYLAAALLRLHFIAACIANVGPNWFNRSPPDAVEYVALAENIARFQAYGSGQPLGQLFGLLRPLGYPLYLAFFKIVGWYPGGALIFQALLAALIPVGIFVWTRRLCRRSAPAYAAALLSAVSPTALGLSGVFLSDMLLGVLLMASLAAIWIAARPDRQRWAPLAGLFLTAGLLIKPILLFMPLLSVVFFLLLCRLRKLRPAWGPILLMAGVQCVAWFGWSWRNYNASGVWIYSAVGAQNLRYYMAPMVDRSARKGKVAAYRTVSNIRRETGIRDRNAVASGAMSPADFYRQNMIIAKRSFAAHPKFVLLVMARNAYDLSEGWYYFGVQLPEGRFRQTLESISQARSVVYGLLCIGMLAAILAVFQRRPADSAHLAELRGAVGLLWTIWLYFLVLNSTSYAQGSRLMYPVEFGALILAAVGWTWLAERAAGLVGRFGSRRPAQAQ